MIRRATPVEAIGFVALSLGLCAVTAACKSENNASTGAGGSGSTTAVQSSSTGETTWDKDSMCDEQLMEPSLNGPGYSPTMGFTGTPQASYVVSTTALYVPADKLDAFNKTFPPVLGQVESAPGMIAVALGADTGCNVYRTLTVWDSQDDLAKFTSSGAHLAAEQMVQNVSEAGKVTIWTATPDEVKALTWEVARSHLAMVPPLY